MPRVIGIDPGTVSIDVCGLDDGDLFLDESYPTRETLADPSRFVAMLESHAPLDLIAGPSGYGLPLRRARSSPRPISVWRTSPRTVMLEASVDSVHSHAHSRRPICPSCSRPASYISPRYRSTVR